MIPAQQPDRKHVLVLWWSHDASMLRPAIRQHLHALDAGGNAIRYHNIRDGVPAAMRHYPFDAVLLHTTLLGLRWSPNFRRFQRYLRWLADSPAVKIAMPQDEYDHSEVLDEWLEELNVHVVASIFDERVRGLLYPRMANRADFLQCHTGYIDDHTASAISSKLQPIAERPLDLVYRACRLPFWFGSHGQLKHTISEVFARRGAQLGLRCDISTRAEDTYLSDDWFAFLGSSKATIGCESGSSVLDRRGEVQAMVRSIQAREPHLTFAEVARRLPDGWDGHRFFAMGPRHLEAVITKTCQILIEGDYDGVLKAHRHYIPVRRDFADLDEALHKVRDHALLHQLTECAYEEIYLRDRRTYVSLAAKLDAVIPRRQATPRARRRVLDPALRVNLWCHDRLSQCRSALRRVLRPAYHLARRLFRA